MNQRSYSSEGVVLSRKNYQEADRILVIYSKHYGKLTLLAKGVRKLKSKKRGHIEIFSLVKFSVVTGNGFDIMTEGESINNFSDIRTNLNKVTLAYYFCEVVNKITREDEKHISTYDLLVKYLSRLGNSSDLKSLRLEFINHLLINLGYWPEDKKMPDPDSELEDVLERKINSFRIGKKVLS